jgi:hypothetical protein
MPKGGVTDRPSRTASTRRPERCPERGLKERSSHRVSRRSRASVRQLTLPLGHEVHGGETAAGTRGEDAPVEGQDLLARVLDPENLRRALRQVRRNKGAPGIDGMSVDQLGPHLKTHWPTIRASLVDGTYTPHIKGDVGSKTTSNGGRSNLCRLPRHGRFRSPRSEVQRPRSEVRSQRSEVQVKGVRRIDEGSM